MLHRILWAAAGTASTIIGLVGIVIPIIPGLLFLLFAAVCFTRAARSGNNATRKLSSAQLSFADEVRRDLHEQYRRLARYQRRSNRR